MASLLRGLLIWVFSSFLLKLTAVLGVGIVTYKTLYTLVESFLDLIQPALNGLPAYILDIITIAGAPEALSVVSGAVITRAAFNSARAFVGVLS